jgi:endonuclease YncB( thermonuclease family)
VSAVPAVTPLASEHANYTMTKSLFAILLLLLLSIYADHRPSVVPQEARWVKVDRVTDRDTIVLMDRTRVRLHGIDAPERGQPYGRLVG